VCWMRCGQLRRRPRRAHEPRSRFAVALKSFQPIPSSPAFASPTVPAASVRRSRRPPVRPGRRGRSCARRLVHSTRRRDGPTGDRRGSRVVTTQRANPFAIAFVVLAAAAAAVVVWWGPWRTCDDPQQHQDTKPLTEEDIEQRRTDMAGRVARYAPAKTGRHQRRGRTAGRPGCPPPLIRDDRNRSTGQPPKAATPSSSRRTAKGERDTSENPRDFQNVRRFRLPGGQRRLKVESQGSAGPRRPGNTPAHSTPSASAGPPEAGGCFPAWHPSAGRGRRHRPAPWTP
jgi:hypothetical protein